MKSFNRPPRVRAIAEPTEISFPDAPAAPRRYARSSIAKVLLICLLPTLMPPLALGLATILIGAPSTILITSSALMVSLGLAIGVTTIVSRGDETNRIKADQQAYEAARAEFANKVAAVSSLATEIVTREAQTLSRGFPTTSELVTRATSLHESLWERRSTDGDFLELRLGTGRRMTCLKFPALARAADPLIAEVVESNSFHEGAPIALPLQPPTRVGAFGNQEAVTQVLSSLVLQAACLHAPEDLAIVVLTRDDEFCSWVKWLPHCRVPSKDKTAYLVGRTGAEAAPVLRAVGQELASRAGDQDGQRYLVIADARGWPSLPGRLARWLPGSSPALSVVMAQDQYEELTGDCDYVLDLTDAGAGRLRRRLEPGDLPSFQTDSLSAADALRAALSISGLATGGGGTASPPPRSSRLVDLLGEHAFDAARILQSWNESRRAFSLSAPIGVGPADATVELDLRKDGPHGLIAGTTGSGKSELLQSMVVSYAARIPPDLLNFVLIDYKGGSTFREVTDLPHVVGVVTDLDDRLAERALISLRAELKRREHLFAAVRPSANNIIEYQSLQREVPVANLVIIIDEFHRLVSEQPDFIEQMVQIAQQGRSLGVHLFLSTQKPSGVVSEHIRANTNLRICLRVTDEADSRDILGSSEAAHIARGLPGRLYMRTGTEPLEVCQAARISGMAPARSSGSLPIDVKLFLAPVAPRAARGQGVLVYETRAEKPETSEDTSVEQPMTDERAVIVEAIRLAAARGGFPEQDAPWSDYLPRSMPLADLPLPEDGSRLLLNVGLLDEPELQNQRSLEVDLEAGHVCVAGGARTGKTTALLSLAVAAARLNSPHEMHVYGIDFAGGDLTPLDSLPHCGGVAEGHDEPRVKWVVQAVVDIIADRLASKSAARDGAGGPRILVVIDNFPAFYTALQNGEGGQDLSDQFLEAMDIGRTVGVSFAVSVERPSNLRSSVLTLMHTRLALQFPDEEGYSALGIRRQTRSSESIPGRAILAGRVPHEVQIAEPGDIWSTLSSGATGPTGPLKIAPLPDEISHGELMASYSEEAGGDLLLGLREGTRPLFTYPIGQHLVVLGPRNSGRSNALAVAVAEAQRQGQCRVLAVNPRRSSLLQSLFSADERLDSVYAERADEVTAVWEEIERLAAENLRNYQAGDEEAIPESIIVIDDLDTLEIPPSTEAVLQQVALRGADIKTTLFVSADTQALRSAYSAGLTRALLNLRQGILLNPGAPEDFDFFGVRGRPSRMPPGRGYACSMGTKHAVQLALLKGRQPTESATGP